MGRRATPVEEPCLRSRKAPLPKEPTRRERSAAERSQDTVAGSALASITPEPPATISVSIGPRQPRRLRSATSPTVEEPTGPFSGATNSTA